MIDPRAYEIASIDVVLRGAIRPDVVEVMFAAMPGIVGVGIVGTTSSSP